MSAWPISPAMDPMLMIRPRERPASGWSRILDSAARQLFIGSIIYLPLVWIAMICSKL